MTIPMYRQTTDPAAQREERAENPYADSPAIRGSLMLRPTGLLGTTPPAAHDETLPHLAELQPGYSPVSPELAADAELGPW